MIRHKPVFAFNDNKLYIITNYNQCCVHPNA